MEESGNEIIKILSWHLPMRGIEENHENLRIAVVSVENRTNYLPNESLGLYLQINLLATYILKHVLNRR
jgi:hypothetical protein